MNTSPAQKVQLTPLTVWERLAYLFGRMIVLFAMFYIPLIFYTLTWRHFAIPKMASFQFLTMLLIVCWIIVACSRRFVRSALATPAAFFFVVIMLTSLVAVNLAEAWETVIFTGACLTVMVLTPKFFTRLRDFEVVVFLLGILCIFVDIYALGQWFNWEYLFSVFDQFGLQKFTHKPVASMGNENYLGEFLNMGLPICLCMIFCHWRKPMELIFYSFVTLLNAVTMLYIDCNASYMGFLFSVPIVLILLAFFKVIPWIERSGFFNASRESLEKTFRHIVVLGILALAILATILASTDNRYRKNMATMASWVDVNGDNRPDGVPPIVFRLQCMDATIRCIRDVPITGIGAGNFKVIHPLYESQLERKVLGTETLARKAHNDHLHHAVEYGVFGLFSWYWIISTSVLAIFWSFQILRRREGAGNSTAGGFPLAEYEKGFYFYLQLGMLGAILTALISCAFGHTFILPSSAVTYWIISGVCVAAFQALHRAERKVPTLIMGVTPEAPTPAQRITRLIPGPVRYAFLFAIVLPFGAMNTYQIIGELWLRQGMILHGEDSDDRIPNYPTMFMCFQKAMQIWPYQMETYYILGRYYIDAIQEFDQAKVLIERGEEDKAIERLRMVGLTRYDREQMLREGIVALQNDIFMNPNYKWAHNNLGVLYDKHQNLTLSELAYSRVFAIDREQIFAHYNLGLGYIRRNLWKKAVERLEFARMFDPSYQDVNRYMANCFINLRDYGRAMTAADKFLSIKILERIDHLSDRYPRKTFQPILDDLEKRDLISALRKAQGMIQFQEPYLYLIYLKIAALQRNDPNGDLDLALDAIQKAELSVSAPPDQEFALEFGDIYLAKNNFGKAAEKYESFLRINPRRADVLRKLATCYLELGDYPRALRAYEPILELDANNWGHELSFARILLANNIPWADVYPHVAKAIALGTDSVREIIVKEDASSYLGPFLVQDEALRKLMGDKYLRMLNIEDKNTLEVNEAPTDATPSAQTSSAVMEASSEENTPLEDESPSTPDISSSTKTGEDG